MCKLKKVVFIHKHKHLYDYTKKMFRKYLQAQKKEVTINQNTESTGGTVVLVFVNYSQTGGCVCMYTTSHWNKSNDKFVNGLESH